jgi:hypothetical protein
MIYFLAKKSKQTNKQKTINTAQTQDIAYVVITRQRF